MRLWLIIFVLFLPRLAQAEEISDLLYGLQFGQSLEQAKEKIIDHCDEFAVLETDNPQIPIAAKTESHIVCTGLTTTRNQSIGALGVTFGDDKLKVIEVRGNAIATITPLAKGQPVSFLGYDLWMQSLLIAETDSDRLWLVTEESVHPHYFLWENPYIANPSAPQSTHNKSALRPEFLTFGASVADLQPRFEKNCEFYNVEEIAKPWLPTNPEEQRQVNCFGFDYAGFPRKIEAVFGNDKLQLLWILTGKAEEDRIRAALVRDFGPANTIAETYETFDEGRVALRKDKPEIMMIPDSLVPLFAASVGTE